MPSLSAAGVPSADAAAHLPSAAIATSPDLLMDVLFEWRVVHENQLRLLTTIQRYLEKVRSPSVSAGERSLLVAEIQRLLGAGTSDSAPFRQRAHALATALSP